MHHTTRLFVAYRYASIKLCCLATEATKSKKQKKPVHSNMVANQTHTNTNARPPSYYYAIMQPHLKLNTLNTLQPHHYVVVMCHGSSRIILTTGLHYNAVLNIIRLGLWRPTAT